MRSEHDVVTSCRETPLAECEHAARYVLQSLFAAERVLAALIVQGYDGVQRTAFSAEKQSTSGTACVHDPLPPKGRFAAVRQNWK